MELPKINLPGSEPGGMLDNIKSRLGFAPSEPEPAHRGYDEGYDDGYDDGYDGYEDGYEEGYDGYDDDYGESSRYEPYAPVTTRTSGRTSSYSSSPRLVTIDDVKANDRLGHSPLPETRGTGFGNRVVIDNTAPAPSSPASASAQRERSEGLDSLFTPTASASSAGARSYEPAQASGKRNLTVIRPMAYNDVERVSKILRAGDVVVLSLKTTPSALFNRVLDFSFGVASALDAHVDCVGAKVFAITCGGALTEAEKTSLRTQGLI